MLLVDRKFMNRPLVAVVLAGRIRPTPLSQALDVHVLRLPVGKRGSLLDSWLSTFATVGDIGEIRIVVNAPADVESVGASVTTATPEVQAHPLRIMAEPAAWRGAGGILRDVTADLPAEAIVVVGEAMRLPPRSLQSLLAAFDSSPEQISGVVGVCGADEPAGVYAFTRSAIDLIPGIGYFDMKEQFLPAIARSGGKVITARLSEKVWRLRDLESYLETARQSLASCEGQGSLIRVSDRASVSSSAVLDGFCMIEEGAVIEDGAVIHDSVVLWGATVGGGAVVSQSIVGPLAQIEPRTRVIRECVTRPLSMSNGNRITRMRRAVTGSRTP